MSESTSECCERRRTDINVWEKRVTLWFMAALISIATAQVVEVNTSVKLIRKDIDANMKTDEGRDVRLDVLVSEQNKIKIVQNGHEIRLETVEERLKTNANGSSKDGKKSNEQRTTYP